MTVGSWFDGATYDALSLRQVINGGLLTHDKHAVTAREGVLTGMNCTTSGTTAYLHPGLVAVSPDPESGRGTYLLPWEGGNLNFGTPDSSARFDAVTVRVKDDAFDGSGQRDLQVVIIKGTPGASPVGPTVPSGSLLLHHVRVAANTGSTSVVDKRVWTASNGGVLAGHSDERLALPTEHLRKGQQWIDVDTGIRRTWMYGKWVADQPLGYFGVFGAGDATGFNSFEIPQWTVCYPDINHDSGVLGTHMHSMTMQRYSRVLQPIHDSPGRFDITWRLGFTEATAPGEVYAGILLNPTYDPTETLGPDLSGDIIAESHAPLSTVTTVVRDHPPGTALEVVAQGVKFTTDTTFLVYCWHSSPSPVGLRFRGVETHLGVSRIGF